ncbi:Asp-tRNA(Asn)/Glu-tRNA(Gln) amidotransferase subunit GatB [Chloroflexota bacterium]
MITSEILRNEYEPVIGLEIHAELNTRSKMFCGCDASHYSALEPNINICPTCVGLPGAMPVLNQKALEMGVMVGIALNCNINEMNVFSRKNYFYPDLPKGYQISQYDHPVASNGWLDVMENKQEIIQRIRIRRAHLEEDTAKLSHERKYALIDFNRSGVPLLEIVTEPDLHTIESTLAFANKIRTILRYLDVNSGNMEEGILRFEANVSIRRRGSSKMNTRTEIKNLNSFRSMSKAINYEIERQEKILSNNSAVAQETLGWDEIREVTVPQRGKEESHDYRYYPEPDIPPVFIDKDMLKKIRNQIPEMPDSREIRFSQDYGLSRTEARILVNEKDKADYFEITVKESSSPINIIYSWLIGEMTSIVNERKTSFKETHLTPERFARLLDLYTSGRINDFTAKEILNMLFETDKNPEDILVEMDLGKISNVNVLSELIDDILEKNSDLAREYLGGKNQLFQWFMGLVSKETKGRSDPSVVKKLLNSALSDFDKE